MSDEQVGNGETNGENMSSATAVAPKKKTKSAPKAAKPAAKPAKAAKPAAKPAKTPARADNSTSERASQLFKMVGDPTRINILNMIKDGPINVTTMVGNLNMSQPSISHHLALLRAANIVHSSREGKEKFYSLTETGELLAGVVAQISSEV